MSNAIGWYLTELRMLLAPHLSAARVVEISKETRVHLELEAERLAAQLDLGNEEAAWLAIEAFGEPRRVAYTYLRESVRTVFGLQSRWAILAGALVAILCWNFHWLTLNGPFDNYGETWQNGIAGVVGVVALVLFLLGCRASFRWNGLRIASLSVATALVLVPLLSVWIVSDFAGSYYQGVSRLHLSRDGQKLRTTLGRLDALENYIERGKTAFARASSITDLPSEYREFDAAAAILGRDPDRTESVMGASLAVRLGPGGRSTEPLVFVPTNYTFAMVDGRIFALGSTDFAMAKEAWKNPSGVGQQRDSVKALLGAVNEASNGRLFFFNPWLAVQTCFWTLSVGTLLLALDLSMWLLVRRRKAKPGMALA